MSQKILISMVREWLDANPYMFDVGGELTDPETQARSTHFPHVVIHQGRTRMGEELYWILNEENEMTYDEMVEALDLSIDFGEYLFVEGGNQVSHPHDYGFESEAEAKKWFVEKTKTPENQAELSRLAWLRSIKEAIQ